MRGDYTPWNFPIAMITRKCAPGLAVGCTFVVKPAGTNAVLRAGAGGAGRAGHGMPKGVFNIITCDSRKRRGGQGALRVADCEEGDLHRLHEVGRILMRQSADTVKKMGLELGGSASFIVFDDADIDAAVEGAMASKYRNTGQTCVCANRHVRAGQRCGDAFAAKLTGR